MGKGDPAQGWSLEPLKELCGGEQFIGTRDDTAFKGERPLKPLAVPCAGIENF